MRIRIESLLLASALLGSGCLVDTIARDLPPDAPIELHAPSVALFGASTRDVLIRSDRPLGEHPVDTRTIRRVAEQSKDAVISLYTKTKTPVRVRLLPIRIPGGGFRTTLPGEALGTGFFVHPSGLVLTNAHVIEDAEEIRGLTVQGVDFGLRVVAVDPVYDIALLQAVGLPGSMPVLPMGSSDVIGVGDLVIAVGNPLGLGHTVTLGIVSQTDRSLIGVPEGEGREAHFIQTDAAINPGSSGGPLITLDGAWVGMNTAGVAEAQNVGFAVPSSQVEEFLAEVIAGRGMRVE